MTPAHLGALIARIKDGDGTAMRDFHRATHAKLFGVIVRILTDRSESEDILQDVYVNVWVNADKFKAETGSAMSWLIVMAKNRSIDRLRRRGRIELDGGESALRLVDPEPSSFAQLEARQQAVQVQVWLAGIEPRAAAALRLAFFEGRTYLDVAKQLDLPPGTVKSLIRRNLIHLRSQVEHEPNRCGCSNGRPPVAARAPRCRGDARAPAFSP